MKRTVTLVFLFLLCAGFTARAQSSPSAYRGQLTLNVGGMGSVFQPDYAGGGIVRESSNRLWGFGVYADLKATRWIGVEGEARWLRQNAFADITEDNYLIGPKIPIREFRFKRLDAIPYGKALFGIGRMNFEYNEAYGRFSDIALGGGVDLKLTRHISVRPFDFEYQLWPNWINGTLKPYGASAGLAYKVF